MFISLDYVTKAMLNTVLRRNKVYYSHIQDIILRGGLSSQFDGAWFDVLLYYISFIRSFNYLYILQKLGDHQLLYFISLLPTLAL